MRLIQFLLSKEARMLAVLVDFETPVLEGMEGVCGKEDKEVRKREFLLAGLVSPY